MTNLMFYMPRENKTTKWFGADVGRKMTGMKREN
jgi:hypothetical protein